jgi:hypothetical protein
MDQVVQRCATSLQPAAIPGTCHGLTFSFASRALQDRLVHYIITARAGKGSAGGEIAL